MNQPMQDSTMTRRLFARTSTYLTASLLAFAVLPTIPMQASDDCRDDDRRFARVFPPHSSPYGLSYPEWHVKWWQWSISIPWDTHPYQGAQFAAVNQSGPVWFLVGYTDGQIREITVPRGKSLFFPILNVESSNVEPAPYFGADEAGMRAANSLFVFSDMVCVIDGLPVRNLERFQAESPLFSFNAPDGNILIGDGPVSGLSVDSGTYVMVPPLSAGRHVIHFEGTMTHPMFGSIPYDATYHITVPRR